MIHNFFQGIEGFEWHIEDTPEEVGRNETKK